jgi:hypothetical protein
LICLQLQARVFLFSEEEPVNALLAIYLCCINHFTPPHAIIFGSAAVLAFVLYRDGSTPERIEWETSSSENLFSRRIYGRGIQSAYAPQSVRSGFF